jgi:hypothetical protein
MGRLHLLGIAALLLAACEEKKRNAPMIDQTASITVVSAADGGQATTAVMIGETDAFPLPAGDQPAVGRQPELRAPGVYLVRLLDGSYRPVYLGSVSLFFGPRLTAEEALLPITFVGGAAVAWHDPELRRKVLDVARERRRGELAPLLVAVSYDPSIEWRTELTSLTTDDRDLVKRELAPVLDGERPERMFAAAMALDLEAEPAKVAAQIAARGVQGEHWGTALLLRSLPAGKERETIACTILANAESLQAGDALLAAALLAVRGGKTFACVDAVRTVSMRDRCLDDVRCAAGVPLANGGLGDEPTCTKEEAISAADRDARQPKWELANRNFAAQTTILALAALSEANAVPAAFTTAQASRRYAIDAHGPACEGASPGAACTPEESGIRLAACSTIGSKGSTGDATFVIDTAARKLRDVRRIKGR